MFKQKHYNRIAGLIILVVFVFTFIFPITGAKADNFSKLATEIIKLNNNDPKYYYTTDNRVKEVIVEPSKLNDYKSEFTGQDPCTSQLDHIKWTWKSTYNREVRPSNANISTPISSYTGGGLTYRTSTLIFYVIYKDKDGKERMVTDTFEMLELGNEFIEKFQPAFNKAKAWSDPDRILFEQYFIKGEAFERLITEKGGLTPEQLKTIEKIHVASVVHIRESGKTVAL